MRRFTDPVLLFALFVIDVVAWAILSLTSGIPVTDPGKIAPMAVGTVVVIAAPALLIAALMALWRSISNHPPRSFHLSAMCASIVGSAVTAAAGQVTKSQDIQVGFTFMAWLFGIMAFAFLVAWIIALTGGIPTPEKEIGKVPKESAKAAKDDDGGLFHRRHKDKKESEAETAPEPALEPATETMPGLESASADSAASTWPPDDVTTAAAEAADAAGSSVGTAAAPGTTSSTTAAADPAVPSDGSSGLSPEVEAALNDLRPEDGTSTK